MGVHCVGGPADRRIDYVDSCQCDLSCRSSGPLCCLDKAERHLPGKALQCQLWLSLFYPVCCSRPATAQSLSPPVRAQPGAILNGEQPLLLTMGADHAMLSPAF